MQTIWPGDFFPGDFFTGSLFLGDLFRVTFSGAFLPGDYFFLGKENQVTLFSGDFFVIRLQKNYLQ